MNIYDFYKILSYEEVVSFGRNQKNRQINEQHVADFINLIKDKEYIEDETDSGRLIYGIMPIIYNPVTNHVLDGQHRLEAFKVAHERGYIDSRFHILVGMWSIFDESCEKEIIIMLNSNSKNWQMNDYMDSYAQTNEYYAKLKNFCASHHLCQKKAKNGDKVTLCYRYGAAIIKGRQSQTALRKEEFTVSDEELAIANIIHEEMVQIRQKLGMPYVTTDVEAMAIEWRVQRQFISKDEIKSLSLTSQIKEFKPKNRSEWTRMFSLLKDRRDKINSRIEEE